MKQTVRFGVRKKLFLFVVIAFSLLIGLTLWQVRYQAKKAAEKAIDTSLTQASTILETYVSSQFYSIREVANSISKDGRVLPLVFENDSPTLQDLSLEFQRALAFDSIFFINSDGEILARSDRPEAIGRNLKGKSAIFDTAFSGETTQGAIVSGGKLLQIVVEPIVDNLASDVVRGLVAVAYELSEDVINDVKKLTSSEVGIYIFDRNDKREIAGVSKIYLTDTQLLGDIQKNFSNPEHHWEKFDPSTLKNIRLELNDEVYYSVVKPIASYENRPLGFVITFHSESDLMEPFYRIEIAVLAIGILCLIFSIAIAMFLSIRISAPLMKLVDITDRIQEGQYPDDKPSAVTPGDEIELLFNTVIKMGNSIREKSELESYLADITISLETPELIDAPPVATSHTIDVVDRSIEDDADRTMISDPKDIQKSINKSSVRNRRAIDGIDAGSVIDGRYELVKAIGAGVFGRVFLARDRDLSEDIAIKIMDKNRMKHSEVDLDIHEEIKLARRITHRNITRTYDFGTFENFLYITMEYVEGYTLEELINQKGAISLYPAIILAKQLCAAMHAAHEQGIIHRDLKPQNIAINQHGVLKIMDFGLAISLNSISDEQREKIQKFAAGTPRFMAPEQFIAQHLDVRTDIYALGALMYYVFSGQPPYASSRFEELAQLHLHAEIPSLLDGQLKVLPEIDTIVRQAMQKDPSDRFQSAKDMFDELNNIRTS